ncbi:DedA family protein [Benzoatithermus flavus]|uniref:DedA family protein n=1 Tax=Benzoatithermus flavus TaxID=3108223 RepID=A0ABU8XUK2_9PROT
MSFLPPPSELLGTWGYAAVLALATAQAIPLAGVVVPMSALLVLAGIGASQGMFEVGSLIGFAAVGAILGDGLSYGLGTRGRHLFRPGSRWLDPVHLAKGQAFFARHGDKSIFIGRVIGPIRGIVPFVAGLSAMSWRTFLLWNVVSGIVWAMLHVLAGYLLGDTAQRLGAWTGRAGLALLPLAAFGGLIWLLRRRGGLFLRRSAR